MASTIPKDSKSSHSCYRGYHHVTWYVGNAKQAAAFYTMQMGFELVARRGLETGSRNIASHVISNGTAIFVLTSPIRNRGSMQVESEVEKTLLDDIHNHIEMHGDSIKDVAFEVDDTRAVYERAVSKGAISVQAPSVQKDSGGEIITAVIQAYGNVTHTLVERSKYRGIFLPGFKPALAKASMNNLLPPIRLASIDHVVGNQGWNEMERVCQ